MSPEETLVLLRGVVVPRSEVGVEVSRSSGPGGQHVNKTESRVTLRFNVLESPSIPEDERGWLRHRLRSRLTRLGELLVSCDSHRDQARNRSEAFERLETLLRTAMERPQQRKKTRPTRASVQRRLETKRSRSQRKRLRRPPGPEE